MDNTLSIVLNDGTRHYFENAKVLAIRNGNLYIQEDVTPEADQGKGFTEGLLYTFALSEVSMLNTGVEEEPESDDNADSYWLLDTEGLL